MTAALDRRQFLQSSVAAGVASLAPTTLVARDSKEDSAPVVDTHLHCFAGPDDDRFPYHARAPYQPSTAATPEHLLKCMDGAGVDYAVVVHPEPYQDDHRYLEHCLDTSPRLKGTCLFFSDRPGSVLKLPQLVKKYPDRIVAARVHAYAPERRRLPPFGSRELTHLWKTAADHGLAMQLHFEPKFAPGFEPLIKQFKDTTVILDHLGRPMQGTPEEHAVVVRWSEYPNTIMKVSSIPRQDKYPHRDVKPIIRELTAAWGADRMIYGGGFNADATPASYRAYRQMVQSLLSHLSADEQNMILGGTAARLYGFVKARAAC